MPSARIINLVEDSISENPTAPGAAAAMIAGAASYIVRTGDMLPPWWSRHRDIELHRFLKDNNHLSGLSYLATTKLANIPLSFVPKDPTITSHVDAGLEFTEDLNLGSEFGETLRATMKKFIEDYLVLDNGGFIEIKGPGRPDGPITGRVHSLRHLDSINCVRTGDRRYPVRYYEDGKWWKFHWTRIIYLSQNPSSRAAMNGVGFSALSRSFMLGQILKDQLTYKMEKMGSRPTSKLIVGNNISGDEMLRSFMIAEELMNELDLTRYAKNVFIGGENVSADHIDLNNFEPFNEEQGTMMAMYALAFAWGLDIRDIWPVTGGGQAGEQVAHMRARGRLPADFTADMANQMDLKVCPPYLKTQFDFKDDEEDQQRALIMDIRSRRLERMAKTKTLDREAMRRLMLLEGDLPREEFVRQQLEEGKLEDGNHVATLFYSSDPIIRALTTLDNVDEPLHFEDNDPDEVTRAIHVRQANAYAVIAQTRSTSQQRRAKQALAALDWLEQKYVDQGMSNLRAIGMEDIVGGGDDEEE